MGIEARIKDIQYIFECNNSYLWNEIVENCPVINEVFPEKIHPGLKKISSSFKPLEYEIKYNDSRLKKAMSDIDRFRNQLSFSDSVYNLAGEIRKLMGMSMSKKKNLKVKCLWKKGYT